MAYGLGFRYLTSLPINVSASGDNVIVPAVAGSAVKAYRFLLVATAAVTVQIKDGVGGTALTGPMSLAANEELVLTIDHLLEPWAVTSLGNALVLTLGGAVGVAGKVDFLQQP